MPERMDAVDPTGLFDGYAPAVDYEQHELDEELAKRLKEEFDTAFENRLYYERDWELFRHYLKGDQLIVHKSTGQVIRLAPEDNKRLRSQNNVLRPIARSLVGKLTRQIPTVRVLPASSDFEDMHGALTADALLQQLRRKENLDLVYQEACEYLPAAGNGIIQVYWDRLAGDSIATCAQCDYKGTEDEVGLPCPTCQLEAQQVQAMEGEAAGIEASMGGMPQFDPVEVPTLEEAKEGDVKVYCHDIRDFFIDPSACTVKEARWVCLRRPVPVAEARKMFPEMSVFLEKEEVGADRASGVRFQSSDFYGKQEDYTDHLFLHEFHEVPTESYPQGRIIWMANETILREIEHPIYKELGRFPFFHFGWDKNIGEFYHEPFIAQAWHRQREINTNETAIREHMELLLKPKVLIPLGSRIMADEFSATTAQTIAYNAAAGRPDRWDPPPVPSDLYNRGQILRNDIGQQAGVTDADMGIMGSDPNGRAMAIINAEASNQIGPIVRRNNNEWRELHRSLLIFVQKFYDQDRTWTIAGPDGVETFYFHDMRLTAGWDIQLEQFDGMSTNSAVRFQQAVDLLNAGFFMDPATGGMDKKSFARSANLQAPERGYNVELTERAAAAQIPEKVRKGEPIMPNYEDDPLIFGEVLLGWLRGPGRREDPMLVQQVRQIWQFYTMWAMSGVMPNPEMMGMGGEGGAGAGGPDQSGPGGTANSPGNMGQERAGQSIGEAAQEQTQQADFAAEQTARQQA